MNINVFKEYPSCCDDRTRLKAILLDIIPNQKAKINLLLQAFDEGIKQSIDETEILDRQFVYRWTKIIIDGYGSSQENAEWVVNYWVNNYGKDCLNKKGNETKFEMPIRELPIYLVIDNSKDLSGEKIGCLNHFVQEFILGFRCFAKEIGNDVDITIKVLTTSPPNWMAPRSELLDDFIWKDISVNEDSKIGDSLEILMNDLDEKYSEHTPNRYIYGADIIFVLATTPTDKYDEKLNELIANQHFKKASKIGIEIGQNADESLLDKLLGGRELLFNNNIEVQHIYSILGRTMYDDDGPYMFED